MVRLEAVRMRTRSDGLAMRVLMVVRAADEVGGLEASFGRIAAELRAAGIVPEALVVGGDGALSATAVYLGDVMRVRTATTLREIWRALSGVDVVHVHAATTTIWSRQAAVMARLRRKPVIVTLHLPSHPYRTSLRGRLRIGVQLFGTGALLRLTATTVCAPSSAAAALAGGRLAAWRTVVLPLHNGVPDPGPAELPNAAALHVVFVGRLADHKRPLDFIATVESVRDRGVDITATLVGDGPLRTRVEDTIKASTYASSFRLAGHLDDPSAVIRTADVLVHASATEGGFPLAAMEAAALGRVILLRAGIEGLAEDWTGAVLTVPQDAEPASFADAILQLHADRTSLQALGSAARSRFLERYSARSSAGRLRRLYEDARA